MKIDINVGKDYYGDFLEYSMKDEFDKTIGSITRQYYKVIEEKLLENMPDTILYDLEIKIHNEIKRRGKN